jgi:hypothetical protein
MLEEGRVPSNAANARQHGIQAGHRPDRASDLGGRPGVWEFELYYDC